MTADRVIGKGNEVPWRISDDLRLFKKITTGNIVVMGKNTWCSIPERYRPLEGRTNIIVSSTLDRQHGAFVCRGIDSALKEAENHNGEIFCIGGAQLYGEMIRLSDEMHISWVKRPFDGDKMFPEIDFDEWDTASSVDYPEFTYKRYVRKR